MISAGVKAELIKDFFINYKKICNNFTIDFEKDGVITYEEPSKLEKWKVSIIDTGLNTLKGARIKKVAKYLDNDLNMLTYGDGLIDLDINKLVKFHKSHNKILTITGVHPPARFGEIKIQKDGQIVSFLEKPLVSAGLINGGYMIFNKNLMNYLTEDENCDLEYEPFQRLLEDDEIRIYEHLGAWFCLDSERDLNYLNNQWNNNQAFWKVWD